MFLSAFSSFPGSLDTSIAQLVKNEGKGAKRKTSEEEKNGSEELVEKKVCKGFRQFENKCIRLHLLNNPEQKQAQLSDAPASFRVCV